MKKTIVGLLLTMLAVSPTLANCGNDNGNGNGCSGNTGPQGPAGPQGNAGANGTNGTDGKNGPQALDPRMNEAKLGIDTAVRLYDGKRIQLQAYNVWSPSMHDKEDTLGDGRNLMYGVRVVFKLGASWEEELIAKQAAQLTALEAEVARLQQ